MKKYERLHKGVKAMLFPLVRTEKKEYKNFDELYNDAVYYGIIHQPQSPSGKLYVKKRHELLFNVWLEEEKAWRYGSNQYTRYLTKEHIRAYLRTVEAQEEEQQAKYHEEQQTWNLHPASKNETEPSIATFDELFHDPSLIEPCLSVLTKLDHQALAHDMETFIGAKAVAVLWMQELKNQSFIKPLPNKIYAALLKQKFAGFTVDPSMFSEDKMVRDANKIRAEIKALLREVPR
jgi:type I restriction-modification system DNA methylase subunit